MTDPRDGQRPPPSGRRAHPASSDPLGGPSASPETEGRRPEGTAEDRRSAARLADDLALGAADGRAAPAAPLQSRGPVPAGAVSRGLRGGALPVPSLLVHPPILPPAAATLNDTLPRSDSARAIAESLEERERFEQPTQPIDVTGYQELPLPSFATVELPTRTETESRRLPIQVAPGAPLGPAARASAPPRPLGARTTASPLEPYAGPPARPPSVTEETPDPSFAASDNVATSPALEAVEPLPRGRASSAVVAIPVSATAAASARSVSVSESPPPAAVLARSAGAARAEAGAPALAPGRSAGTQGGPAEALSPAVAARPAVAAAEGGAEPPMELAPVVRAALHVNLPCAVLVLDDDRRAAAELASRLLEVGYTCRVVPCADAGAALERERWDAVILDVPADEARGDLGRSRVEALGAFDGPVVLTSSAVLRLDHLRAFPQISGILTKPYFMEVLVQTIEAARDPRGARASRVGQLEGDAPEAAAASARVHRGVERRAAVRHELDVNVVRAVITGGPEGQAARGRVRNLSTAGGMSIDTATRLGPKTTVRAEVSLYDGRMMIFTGRAVRGGRQELALKLDTDDTQSAFLEVYIQEARTSAQRVLPPVRIVVREEGPADVLDDVALTKRWAEVSGRLEDDEAHQRFIQDCLRAGRLELAVARYRELKLERPEDERVSKYLSQIGTILGFYALSKKDGKKDAPPKMPSSMKLVVGLVLLAAGVLLFILRHKARGAG